MNVQSSRFRRSARYVVVPLIDAAKLSVPESDVGPHCTVQNAQVVMDPLQITNMPRELLGTLVMSLAEHEDRIVNALGAMLSGAWDR
jgi:hypothetical protein